MPRSLGTTPGPRHRSGAPEPVPEPIGAPDSWIHQGRDRSTGGFVTTAPGQWSRPTPVHDGKYAWIDFAHRLGPYRSTTGSASSFSRPPSSLSPSRTAVVVVHGERRRIPAPSRVDRPTVRTLSPRHRRPGSPLPEWQRLQPMAPMSAWPDRGRYGTRRRCSWCWSRCRSFGHRVGLVEAHPQAINGMPITRLAESASPVVDLTTSSIVIVAAQEALPQERGIRQTQVKSVDRG